MAVQMVGLMAAVMVEEKEQHLVDRWVFVWVVKMATVAVGPMVAVTADLMAAVTADLMAAVTAD